MQSTGVMNYPEAANKDIIYDSNNKYEQVKTIYWFAKL